MREVRLQKGYSRLCHQFHRMMASAPRGKIKMIDTASPAGLHRIIAATVGAITRGNCDAPRPHIAFGPTRGFSQSDPALPGCFSDDDGHAASPFLIRLASVKAFVAKGNDSGCPHLKHVLDCHTVLSTAAERHPLDIRDPF